jgi:hypothetical protein
MLNRGRNSYEVCDLMDNLNCDVKEKVGPLIDSCKEYSLGISYLGKNCSFIDSNYLAFNG